MCLKCDAQQSSKNEVCPHAKRHVEIQVKIVKRHAPMHLKYHPELGDIENAIYDLMKMESNFFREYMCESCVFSGNCLIQEEEMEAINSRLQ